MGRTNEEAGIRYIKAVPCLSLHVLRSMQRLRGSNAFGNICKYMHAHLPKTMINGH